MKHGLLNIEKFGIKVISDKEGAIVGEKWFAGFMSRWEGEVVSGKCLVQCNNRKSWCIPEHFQNMYSAVYKSMVKCGVAIELDDHEAMFDKEGEEVFDASLMHGRKSRYKLTRPDRCVFVDKTGCNTNQKRDKHIGGRRYITKKGQKEGARIGSSSDLHFTVLAFAAGTGEVIMCAVIMKSEKKGDVPPSWR